MYVLATGIWTLGAIGTVSSVAIAATALYLTARRDNRTEKADTQDRQEERRDLAREEALDLVKVRGEAITELQRELAELQERYQRERDEQLQTIARLQTTIDNAREQTFEMLQMYAHGQRALFMTILGDLERDPPNVTLAVARIHRFLDDPNPLFPGQSAA